MKFLQKLIFCEVLRSHGSQDHGHRRELVHHVLGNSTELVLIVPVALRIPLLLDESSNLERRKRLTSRCLFGLIAFLSRTERRGPSL